MHFSKRVPASRTLLPSDCRLLCQPESDGPTTGSRPMAVLNKMVHTGVKTLRFWTIVCATFNPWLKRPYRRDAKPGFLELSAGLASVATHGQ